MKIMITPTTSQDGERIPYYSVTVEDPRDNLDFDEAVELARTALIAWGYHPKSIEEAFGGTSD